MILSDFECPKCGAITEELIESSTSVRPCKCGGQARRIISLGRVYLGNQDAAWIKSVIDVVDKKSDKAHVKEFLRNPTRTNYKNWMKKEGLRPADESVRGGPPTREVKPVDMSRVHREVYEKYRKRNSLEVHR